MRQKSNALLSWSGGKDSSLALYELQMNKKFQDVEIKALLTTLTQGYDRISMHGVRRDLLTAQSRSLAIPVEEVWIPPAASNEIYQAQVTKSLHKQRANNNVSAVVFGDLFLEDIRTFREKFLKSIGFECLFPVWGRDTSKLARYFVDCGFKAVICTVNPNKLDPRFCGREFDSRFLSEITEGIDPCGENGEFHTFVYDGPIFKDRLKIEVGETIERDGFYFADILLP